MTEWMFDRKGKPQILVSEDDRFIDRYGKTIGWIYGNSAYSLKGKHLGWYEDGILFDGGNRAIGFKRDATGHLPSRPGLSGVPGIPGIAVIPGRPGLSGVPGRPGYGGWSDTSLENFFED